MSYLPQIKSLCLAAYSVANVQIVLGLKSRWLYPVAGGEPGQICADLAGIWARSSPRNKGISDRVWLWARVLATSRNGFQSNFSNDPDGRRRTTPATATQIWEKDLGRLDKNYFFTSLRKRKTFGKDLIFWAWALRKQSFLDISISCIVKQSTRALIGKCIGRIGKRIDKILAKSDVTYKKSIKILNIP